MTSVVSIFQAPTNLNKSGQNNCSNTMSLGYHVVMFMDMTTAPNGPL